jgi:hypothetical protein
MTTLIITLTVLVATAAIIALVAIWRVSIDKSDLIGGFGLVAFFVIASVSIACAATQKAETPILMENPISGACVSTEFCYNGKCTTIKVGMYIDPMIKDEVEAVNMMMNDKMFIRSMIDFNLTIDDIKFLTKTTLNERN